MVSRSWEENCTEPELTSCCFRRLSPVSRAKHRPTGLRIRIPLSNTGAAGLNGDAEVTIEATGPHPHVVQIMSPGAVPEGFALSPDGKVAVAPLIEGSGSPPTAYNYVKNAEAAIMSVGPNGMLKVTGRAKLGAVPEGIAFSPKGDYVYIGNYSDRDLQTFHIEGGKLVQVDHMKLPGQPASMRGPAR